MTTDILLYLAGGVLLGAAITYAIMSARLSSESQLADKFKALSSDALKANNEQFLQLAEQVQKQFQQQTDNQLQQVIKPVGEDLKKLNEHVTSLEKMRASGDSALRELVGTLTNDQQRLRQETSLLVQALRAPNTRGQWGEMQLKRVLDFANMVEGVDYTRQVSGQGIRPDIVVHLPGNKSILLDAKVPMNAYLDAYREGIDDKERQDHMKKHATHVRDHFKTLGSKSYWQQFDSPEFTIMFLPDESYLRVALDYDPTLIEFGAEQKVIPASPTSLIALLRAVSYTIRQEKMAENAKLIAQAGADIYSRLSIFAGHFAKIGKGLDGALESYNSAIGSLEKQLLPGARKLKELNAVSADTADIDLPVIDKTTRNVASPELTHISNENKEAAG